MKKIFTLALAAVLMVAILAVSATAATTTTNLLPNDVSKWKSVAGNNFDATIKFEGTKAIISSTGGWPSMSYEPAKAIEIDPNTAYLNLKFKLVSGGTSIRLISGDAIEGEFIYVHHFIKGATFDSAGDISVPGTYQLSIAFKDLKCYAGTADNVYLGKKDLVLNSKGKFVLNSLQIFAVNGTIEVEKFELSTTPDVVSTPEESSAVSAAESVASTANESSTVTIDSSVPAVSKETSKEVSTVSEASIANSTDGGNENNNNWIWIVIGGVVVVGGIAAFFIFRKKN